MDSKELFKKFNLEGSLILHDDEVHFKDISWCSHPDFEGVELKHIVTSKHTKGQFSYHLVRIAPNKKIGLHIHKKQLETHEVIAGDGFCINNGKKILYKSGVISIFTSGLPHEVTAGFEGLYLFAKFIPALN